MMKTYTVHLKSDPSSSFMSTKAAQSMDIDVTKKLAHDLSVTANVVTSYNVGLIVGNSGSGKTTLTRQIYGDDCFTSSLDATKPIIDQFPDAMTYDDRANILNAIGLSQVVCWIRPVATLSNGQKFRAEAALKIAHARDGETICIDEWTSVVDRTVAKVMSHALQKSARKFNKRFVLCSCHDDVIEWLQPDWVIDCNKQTYDDRRSLRRERTERLDFEIREVHRSTWRMFARYHYLSDRLPGGTLYTFGLFHDDQQIGFQCFANYVPVKKGSTPIYHSNRTVIHPDYVGLGLGIKIIDETSKLMKKLHKFRIMAKFSSLPVYKSMIKNSSWKLLNAQTETGKLLGTMAQSRNATIRQKVKWYSFEYVDVSS
jgi:ABC-type Mn2+/Zn2+ transport system ATPase subunit